MNALAQMYFAGPFPIAVQIVVFNEPCLVNGKHAAVIGAAVKRVIAGLFDAHKSDEQQGVMNFSGLHLIQTKMFDHTGCCRRQLKKVRRVGFYPTISGPFSFSANYYITQYDYSPKSPVVENSSVSFSPQPSS